MTIALRIPKKILTDKISELIKIIKKKITL